MNKEHEHLPLIEEEDVILEGSDLYNALIDMGYSNFNSIPRVTTEYISIKTDSTKHDNNIFKIKSINDKAKLIYQYIFHNNQSTGEILKVILEGNILLDDHSAIINDLFEKQEVSQYRKRCKWLPLIGSTISLGFLIIKNVNVKAKALSFTISSYLAYKHFKCWLEIKNLRYFITLQSKLHHLLKCGLKILKRHIKKPIVNGIYEKDGLISDEKYQIILLLKQLIIEIFENMSESYYNKAHKILTILPESLHSICILTKLGNKNKNNHEQNYDELMTLYYMFILVQSEILLIMGNAYNLQRKDFTVLISKSITKLSRLLDVYYSEISKIISNYQLCKSTPVKQLFRNIQNSIWQDFYNHLDLTSQRIELAHKKIISILETLDIHEKNHSSPQLIQFIIENTDEVYKQIENARSFAEFSRLLIGKILYKPVKNLEKSENDHLCSINDNKKIIIIDKDIEIEDEVFEEYIRKEYLKPLYENSDTSIFENFKRDKLLANNFMIELKEALIEKEKSMNARELKALKRMYNNVLKDSYISNNVPETVTDNKYTATAVGFQSNLTIEQVSQQPCPPPLLPLLKSTPLPPPSQPKSIPLLPPPPPPPLPFFKNTTIDDNHVDDNKKLSIKSRTPLPLPRVKMMQPENMSDVQIFSINQGPQNFKFPIITEETFIGSGENSEEENLENDYQDDKKLIDI